jgi:hypothetical protein
LQECEGGGDAHRVAVSGDVVASSCIYSALEEPPFIQADFPVGFVFLAALAVILAILILFSLFASRH